MGQRKWPPMICPSCGTDNIAGVDTCENCGADLTAVGLPLGASADNGAADPFMAGMQAPLATLAPRQAQVVPSGTAAAEAIARMRSSGDDCLLVAETGRVVGIFTERDAVVKLAGRDLRGITVGEVMTRDPVLLRPDDTVAVAIHKMAVGGFRHIPLVDEGGRAAGVVSAADVFRHALTDRA